jgi:hypothetical protein
MRGVAEEEDDAEVFVFGEFAEKLERFGAGEKLIGFADFVFGVAEFVGEDFGGLMGAEIRAGEEEIGSGPEFSNAFGDLAGFFDALLGEEAIGVGGTFGIFAIDGDAVADDVELHAGGSWEEFTRGMFFVDEWEAVLSSELGGRGDLTQRTQRKSTEFTEVGGREELAQRPALH